MSLLYRILYAAHANGTHHRLALRALELLRCDDAEAWRRVLLKHAATYLDGSKAPDTQFKDFQNHVLHVDDGDWGGAPDAATEWYRKTVSHLSAKRWAEAAFSAGVLSHYVTDPLMPFHTGGSEAEANVHRAAEWSISKSFEPLWDAAPEIDVPAPNGPGWVAEMVRNGAVVARGAYWPLIAHFDMGRAVDNPVEGLDPEARSMISPLLAHAAVSFARILDRALVEAKVSPPEVHLTAETVVAGLQIPMKWVAKRLEDAEDRALVARMHAELVETGRVERHLPQDVRAVRDACRARASERARAEAAARDAASTLQAAAKDTAEDARRARPAQTPANTPFRTGLRRDSDVERAPSIGPKTAERLAAVGVKTIADLIECDPRRIAARLRDRRIDGDEVAVWRDQADLLIRMPRLRSAHAVMLVAAGYRNLTAIAGADPTRLRDELAKIARSERMRRALRNPQAPDLGEIVEWIGKARGALAAAA